MESKRYLIALAFPILVLAVLTSQKAQRLRSGEVHVFPISGYDPRDLLSGNYLQYTVDFGVKQPCEPSAQGGPEVTPGYICLSPAKAFSWQAYAIGGSCDRWVNGTCRSGRFEAGVERFYVPQERAGEVEKKIQTRKAEIELAISDSGKASVVDLLIDGRSWKEALGPDGK